MLMQRRTIFIILISLTILSTSAISAAAGELSAEMNLASEKPYTSLLIFENISTVITDDPYNSIESDVPHTIQSYDVLEIDVPVLQREIRAGKKIPVRFRGISYLMALDPNPVIPNPESGESIYNGNFLSIPHEEIQDYLVRLSFSGDQFEGSVHDIRNSTFVYLRHVENASPAPTWYYVYSSADETPAGARLDTDVWVMLPSGESKLRNELTPEEIEWYRNEQVQREQLRLNETAASTADNSGQVPATAASLPLLVVMMALGLCCLIWGMVKKDR
jgi:hypothetical protein